MVTAVGYLRVSTSDQSESGAGLAAQRSAIEAYAKRHDMTIVAWHEDAGISGAADVGDRPGLAAAVAELRRGGVLLIAKRDRLARDTLLAASIDRMVARRGASIVSADGAGNGDGPADAFMRSVLDAAAAFERGLIRQRTRSAMAAMRKAGRLTGAVPFGWSVDADGNLQPIADEQRILTMIAELRRGGMSLRSIADRLNASNVVPKREGSKWYASTVKSILDRAAAVAA